MTASLEDWVFPVTPLIWLSTDTLTTRASRKCPKLEKSSQSQVKVKIPNSRADCTNNQITAECYTILKNHVFASEACSQLKDHRDRSNKKQMIDCNLALAIVTSVQQSWSGMVFLYSLVWCVLRVISCSLGWLWAHYISSCLHLPKIRSSGVCHYIFDLIVHTKEWLLFRLLLSYKST